MSKYARLISQERIDTSLTNKNNERLLQMKSSITVAPVLDYDINKNNESPLEMKNIVTAVPVFDGDINKNVLDIIHYNEVACLTKQHELLCRLDKLNWANMPSEERNAKLGSDKHQLYLDGFVKESKDKLGSTIKIYTMDFLSLYESYIRLLEN